MDSVPLIHILITVFLWLTYAQSRKDVADAEHLRCVSGAVYAQYVIVYVAAGLCLLAGVIFAVSFSFLTDHSEYIHTLLSGFSTLDSEELALIKNFASLSSIVFLVVHPSLCKVHISKCGGKQAGAQAHKYCKDLPVYSQRLLRHQRTFFFGRFSSHALQRCKLCHHPDCRFADPKVFPG